MTAPMTPEELASELRNAILIPSDDDDPIILVNRLLTPDERDLIVEVLLGSAQTVPSLTDAMIEAGARVAALRRGHKSCDELVTTTNAGKQPVWKFYTEEPRAILEAVFNAAPPSNRGASK